MQYKQCSNCTFYDSLIESCRKLGDITYNETECDAYVRNRIDLEKHTVTPPEIPGSVPPPFSKDKPKVEASATHNIYIYRNNQKYGPYDDKALVMYVNRGQILRQDEAEDTDTGEKNTVKYFLKKKNLKTNVEHAGNIFKQLAHIGRELIIPTQSFKKSEWKKDHRLITLSLMGLIPTCLMGLPLLFEFDYAVFYCVALYFSIIWGMFFYYLFKSDQVSIKTTLMVFFAEQILVFTVWDLLGLPNFNPFYIFTEEGVIFPLDMVGYVLGVGLSEEFAKLIPLLFIAHFSKKPLLPQTLVFYGLMSGIAFGVYEGVEYQMTVNIELDYSSSFFMNIARLTSLPFLHASWCGIAAYFVAFAKLYPRYRISLYLLALIIPPILHGLYDTFCSYDLFFFIAIAIAFTGIIFLTTYIKQGVNYQSKLRN